MNKSNLITKLSNQFTHLSKQDISESITALLEKISETLYKGGRVEIRGFGSFSTRERSSKIGRNPRSGEAVYIDSKYHPYFRTAKRLKAKLNK